MLTVRLLDEIENRLTALAEQTGRPKSYYVREALESYLEDLGHLYSRNSIPPSELSNSSVSVFQCQITLSHRENSCQVLSVSFGGSG
jgi:hypothetical protein